jgi:hypothetical protein
MKILLLAAVLTALLSAALMSQVVRATEAPNPSTREGPAND